MAEPALGPGRAFLVGARSIDPDEQDAIDRGRSFLHTVRAVEVVGAGTTDCVAADPATLAPLRPVPAAIGRPLGRGSARLPWDG